ncbi:hypothetical protein AB6831_04185 [Carnobacterium divergens]|uniref:hypothetical protein n=1 Tax=Carnobacterium divergens TaxID=2748 RepID=UPI0039C9DA70
MNIRQQKKRLKKALEIINKVEVLDADYEDESVLYIHVENNEYNLECIKESCNLLGIDTRKFVKSVSCDIAEYGEGLLDLSYAWMFWIEIKNHRIWHSSKNGFFLKKVKEENN